MRLSRSFFTSVVAASLFLLFTGKGHSAETSKWSSKMQELSQTLSKLLADISSDRKFNDPDQKTNIERNAKKFSDLAHDLNGKGMMKPDSDPTLSLFAGLLANQAEISYRELARGNREFARSNFKSIVGYCISCHTRNSSGPDFSKISFTPDSSLNAIERAEFYAGSRQYDHAQQEFIKILETSKNSEIRGAQWQRASHESLAIAVRVKKSPDEALKVVDAILKNKSVPSYIQEDALTWKTSIEKWKKEPQRKNTSEAQLLAESKRLMAQALKNQSYPMDRSADVFFLRASAVAHDLLQIAKDPHRIAEGLMIAGLSYEILNPLRLENLPEFYYEGCIRKYPHSVTAKTCYRRLADNIYLSYTGSSGTDIPDDVIEKLSELGNLAKPPKTELKL